MRTGELTRRIAREGGKMDPAAMSCVCLVFCDATSARVSFLDRTGVENYSLERKQAQDKHVIRAANLRP